ncbi:MAG TPA: prolyl oligopeptidase family serine peptidase, partial [Flavisolibacter sp.]|nr:prolyl oligopeptidase family serine peptidase [Flavisolibacter sp.]
MKKSVLLLFAFFATHLLIAQESKEPVKLTDMLKIKTAGNLVVNKAGTAAVFTVTSIEPDEKREGEYRYSTQLYKLNLAENGSKTEQLTFSKEGAAQPAWSPDGKTLAFVRSVEGRPQVFLLPMNGGEAYQLTKFSYGASAPKWSPDGSRILFASSIQMKDYLRDAALNSSRNTITWPLEKPGLTNTEVLQLQKGKGNPDGNLQEIRTYLLSNEADGKATVLTKLNFQDETNISSNTSFNQFFTAELKAPTNVKPVTAGFYRYSVAEYTPDGKNLIITADIDSLESPDRSQESQVFMANADGSNLRQLLGKKGFTYNSAKVSPSGKWLAYQYGPINGDIATLAIMPLNGSEKEAISILFDRSKGGFNWSDDEKYLYFTAQSNGGAPLYRVNIASKKVEQLSSYDTGITSYALAGDKILFSQTEVTNPSEVYMADMTLKSPVRLSNLNEWVTTRKLSLPEKKTFVNNKGLTVEYWMMKPANYEAGKKYPLLLEIHGGPSAMWGPGEAGMWHEFQYFAGKGYGVVYSNPRGSGGYGDQFLKANVGDWGAGPMSDVMTALEKT